MIKTLKKLEIENFKLRNLKNPELALYTKWWNNEIFFSLRSRTGQGYPILPLLVIILLEVLASGIKQEKEIKGIKMGQENVSLQMTWSCIENCKELQKMVKTNSSVERSICNSYLYFCTLAMNSLKVKLRK